MLIIGITGTMGAGKGTIVEYLKEKYGFTHFSARAFFTEEIQRRGLPVNRDTMTEVSNDLRATHSPSYLAEQLYEQAVAHGGNCAIESIRTVGEIEALRAKPEKFYLFAVDADPKIRYERVRKRQSTTDAVSFEKFISDEQREFSSDDPTKQNLTACIQLADYNFTNNSDLAALHKQIDEVMQLLN